MEDFVTTQDFYEAAYYLINGGKLVTMTPVKVNGKVCFEFEFAKPGITEMQITYLRGMATVNILHFRRAYHQINAWVQREKKKLHEAHQRSTP